MTESIVEEWDEHAGGFARRWRKAMATKGKIVACGESESPKLRKRILAATVQQEKIAVEKDLRLLEAALASDRIVISADDRMRNILSRIRQKVDVLGNVVWVNPTNDAETPIPWLKAGAKSERKRQLRAWPPRNPDTETAGN